MVAQLESFLFIEFITVENGNLVGTKSEKLLVSSWLCGFWFWNPSPWESLRENEIKIWERSSVGMANWIDLSYVPCHVKTVIRSPIARKERRDIIIACCITRTQGRKTFGPLHPACKSGMDQCTRILPRPHGTSRISLAEFTEWVLKLNPPHLPSVPYSHHLKKYQHGITTFHVITESTLPTSTSKCMKPSSVVAEWSI